MQERQQLGSLSNTEPFGYAQTGQPETAKELLDRTGRWLREDMSQHPELRARLLGAIGRAYRRRGDDHAAVGYFQQALDLHEKLAGGESDVATAHVMTDLAVSTREIGDLTRSDRLLQDAAATLDRAATFHSLLASPRVVRFYTERNLPDRLRTLIETPHQTPVAGQPLPGQDR